MAYFLDLFTPETWQAFREIGGTVTGFRERYRRSALERVNEGDIFLCYLTRLSRWCGVLEVQSEAYHDASPLHDELDPFTVRFKVKPLITLDPDLAIPIRDDQVWSTLTITNQFEKGTPHWTGFFRGSLNQIDEGDGSYLVDILKKQLSQPDSYPLTDKDKRQIARRRTVRTLDREVEVEVPDDEDEDSSLESENVGAYGGTGQPHVNPISSQGGANWGQRWDFTPGCQGTTGHGYLSISLPICMRNSWTCCLSTTTTRPQRTVEQIDVLWLEKGRS